MYTRVLRNGSRTRRFTICYAATHGWEVSEVEEGQVLDTRRYDDWHRVERARQAFAEAAVRLREAGWTEAQSSPLLNNDPRRATVG